ncbi:hypothetical protein [Neomoorella glycerini]|uniref:hypothetical protein n=1 Tax=Neomoorella glycerini TaxID=55779 RepID=UPI0012E1153C|nr:hypothetical protein [Moorella glycerini]
MTNLLLAVGWRKVPNLKQTGGIILAFSGLLVVIAGGSWERWRGFNLLPADAFIVVNVLAISLFNILAQL